MSSRFCCRTRLARATGDDGVALPMVLGVMLVLTAFLLSSLALVVTNMAPARADQDSKAALAAAQAGMDEYIARLNATQGQYWTKGNTDPTNPAFDADATTPGCDGGGVSVPGSGGEGARFCYRVLTASTVTASQGYIDLKVTGTSTPPAGGREVSRTLTTTLRPEGFIDFVYFTDIEVIDPSLNRARANVAGKWSYDGLVFFADPAKVEELCAQHYYPSPDTSPPRSGRAAETSWGYVKYVSGPAAPFWSADDPDAEQAAWTQRTESYTVWFDCGEIQWTGGDVVDGPLHSNDALQVNGPVRFTNPRTESSWNKADKTELWWGSGKPSNAGSDPVYAPTISIPQANTQLLKYVLPKVDSDPNTDRPGCLYTGATRITFVGNQMKVYSPNTTAAGTPSQCLDVGNSGNEQTKAIPPVIYIKPAAGTCTGVGYPRAGEDVINRRTTDYDPCRGTAFVEGKVDGQVTVSAEEDIVVTADLTLNDPLDTDIVGLVAGNFVWVYHPVEVRKSGKSKDLLANKDAVRNIEAAILSLRHSFVVQNWAEGDKLSKGSDKGSKLRVYGAIAQKFRGPVGTGNGSADPATGYLKNYVYDERLQVLQPPYFLAADNAPWRVVQVTDG